MTPAPWLDDVDVRLYLGDNLDVLRQLPDRSVHMCATSPPFYGLRDYNAEGQIGLEDTPDLWVERLVAVFREVRRVLRDDGTLWVEIGDSYGAANNRNGIASQSLGDGRDDLPVREANRFNTGTYRDIPGTKPKDLLGQPWLLAFALRADGWYLRSEIIWARPNPMPESVTDRPTKAHSTVFLLSKRPRYYFDADAIREKQVTEAVGTDGRTPPPNKGHVGQYTGERAAGLTADGWIPNAYNNPAGANARSVWTIPTQPTPFAHFATWPEALVRRMVLAGTSERGCCPECGAPWVRDVERELVAHQATNNYAPDCDGRSAAWRGKTIQGHYETQTLGWSPSCAHDTTPVPCTVLDPFAGSATTMLVARNHGRHSIGIELNEDYLQIAAKRLQQLSLLNT